MQLLMGGKSEDEIQRRAGRPPAPRARTEAIRQLKAFFIVDAAAKQLEVEVEPERGQPAAMYQIAMQQNRRFEKVRQEMGNRGEIEQLYLSIREGKTLDKILEVRDDHRGRGGEADAETGEAEAAAEA